MRCCSPSAGSLASLSAIALMLVGCGGSSGSSSSGPAAGTPAPTATATPTPTPTPTATGTAQVIFSDEFNGASLDRTKWNVVGPDFWVNNEQQIYIDSTETISLRQNSPGADGGVLVLRPVFRPGTDTNTKRNADFVSGRIDSSQKFDFMHGRAEARIRMSDADGFWPAFWLLGYGDWPGSGEIDIMEYVGQKTWISSALHGPGYSGGNALSARFNFPAGQDVTGWHIYAVEWSADRIDFEVDGTVFYSLTKAQVEQRGEWRFDNRKYVILNAALGGNYPNGVNAVTSPYFGLPQSTVDKIKAGQVEIEVDWVRIVREN